MGQKYSKSLAQPQRRLSPAPLLKHGHMLRLGVSGKSLADANKLGQDRHSCGHQGAVRIRSSTTERR